MSSTIRRVERMGRGCPSGNVTRRRKAWLVGSRASSGRERSASWRVILEGELMKATIGACTSTSKKKRKAPAHAPPPPGGGAARASASRRPGRLGRSAEHRVDRRAGFRRPGEGIAESGLPSGRDRRGEEDQEAQHPGAGWRVGEEIQPLQEKIVIGDVALKRRLEAGQAGGPRRGRRRVRHQNAVGGDQG